ncbi:MAG: sigma 54-interacting transcriptional regulator, partial [Bacteroidota bacterium]
MSNPSFKIYVVEDDEWYQKLLVHTLSLNPDHVVKAFSDGASLLKAMNEQPQLVTLDYRLPDYSGSELFDKIKAINPDIEIIIISEQQDIETAIHLLKKGASDYLTKTDDIRDRLIHILSKIDRNKKLEAKVETLQQEVEKKYNFQHQIIGQSNGIKQVFRLIEKAINTNIIVMISGETGTGKEVVAKSIHYNSKRKNKPFVPVNMSAIPRELVESELFGHEKGSFTGASEKHIGKFEQANGGTLFLDEI